MAPSISSFMEKITEPSTLNSPSTIFSRATSSDDHLTCARPVPGLVGGPLYANSDITFHKLAILISAPCLAITVISSGYLAWKHVRNYTAPQEQRQILRIISLPVFYSLFNFLALCWYRTYQYVQPLAGLYQSFAIAALFFLLLEWVCPEGTDREKYFDEFPFKDKKGVTIEGGSLAWFQRTWAQIFQYPLITLVFTIIEIVTQYYGKYCSNSFAPKHAHLWLFLASIFLVAGALQATGAFAGRMKSEMTGTHKERAKIWSFLGIIFFQIIQGILFSLLNGKLFSPTRLLTYNDINYGLPSFLTCLEAVSFSLLFHWSYSAAEFTARPHRHLPDSLAPRVGTWRAVRDALDLSDVANAVWVALGLAWERAVRWWKSEGTDADGAAAADAKRGPVGRVLGFVVGAVVGKREKKGKCSGGGLTAVSPFDERLAAVPSPGPAVPDPAFGSGPGRTRTLDGHGQDSPWLGTARGGYGERRYEPLRSNGSRGSSVDDRSTVRR